MTTADALFERIYSQGSDFFSRS